MDTLVHFDGNAAVAEIEDVQAVLHDYRIVKPDGWPPPTLWARDLVKLHGPREGETYKVRLLPGGRWICNCGDFVHRFRRNRGNRQPGECCKHICAAKVF